MSEAVADSGLEAFRADVSAWLADNCPEGARGPGQIATGSTRIELEPDVKLWLDRCAERGYTAPTWPTEYGGGGLSPAQARVLYEEMAAIRARSPLMGMGLSMIGPTLLEFGTPEQKARHLPPIVRGEVQWCQGYSEPNAGSDLANVRTKAVLDGDEWVIEGQKVWTSLAEWSDWCFVLCRTDPNAPKHRGITYILVPMKQPGIEIRPIRQLTGTSEFAETFFDGARASKDHVIGEVNGGWKIAMATLGFERGASTLGQQLSFQGELELITRIARENGAVNDPGTRRRLADAWIGLRIMRLNALRTLAGQDSKAGHLGRSAMISKLYWATWHREMGKLAMDVLGRDAEIAEDSGDLTALQRLFLFTRADTIYAGTNQIQRNIIGERALGLPKEPRPSPTSGPTK